MPPLAGYRTQSCDVTRYLPRIHRTERAVARAYREATVSATREDCRVTHLQNGHILAQPIAVAGPDMALLWAYSPQLQRRPGTTSVVWMKPSPEAPLKGQTLFAAVNGFSYYHWLLGTLPKLLLARSLGLLASYDHIVVNPRHKGSVNFQTESLALLGIPLEKVRYLDRFTHFVCDHLSLPSDPCARHQTTLSVWAYDLLRQAFLAPSDLATPKRLFVCRSAARRRKLATEGALVAKLAAYGFTPVVLEQLPFAEQVRLFAGADTVLGLHGAGLANAVFCRPGTRLIELMPDSWRNPCFARLATLADLRYARLSVRAIGPRQGFQADATVDPARVLALVEKTLA